MDEITVYEGDSLIYEFGESIMMKCGRETFRIMDEAQLYLDPTIWEIYNVWAKKSTIDGTNKTCIIQYGNMRYIFTNHYWD